MIAPLPSPRHELFAQAVASGWSAAKAYALAYSRPRTGATRASAARLLTDVNVRRRIAELRAQAAEQAKASLQALIPALDERARAAMSAGRTKEAVSILHRLAEIAAEANRSAALNSVTTAANGVR
jgi:hypothetical protein